jgi:hypothetical protein
VSRIAPISARTLADELARLFEADVVLAERLNDAHQRLLAANDRLWTGLHPDGLQALYGDQSGFEAVQLEAAVDSRSEVLESSDPLGRLQEAHWAIHRAHHDYQEAGEDRRHLAADIGEAIGRFVDALVAAGWTEEEARNADVRAIARGVGDG